MATLIHYLWDLVGIGLAACIILFFLTIIFGILKDTMRSRNV